jgi:hypothetical protein
VGRESVAITGVQANTSIMDFRAGLGVFLIY